MELHDDDDNNHHNDNDNDDIGREEKKTTTKTTTCNNNNNNTISNNISRRSYKKQQKDLGSSSSGGWKEKNDFLRKEMEEIRSSAEGELLKAWAEVEELNDEKELLLEKDHNLVRKVHIHRKGEEELYQQLLLLLMKTY